MNCAGFLPIPNDRTHNYGVNRIAAALTWLCLAACAPIRSDHSIAALPNAQPAASGQYLYVANSAAHTVTVYGPNGRTLVSTISVRSPAAPAFDPARNFLYVLGRCCSGNDRENFVRAFRAHQAKPMLNILAGYGDGIALGPAGDLYVAGYQGNPGAVFPPRAARPAATLTMGSPTYDYLGISVAVAADGTAYVGNRAAGSEYAGHPIGVFPRGASAPSSIIDYDGWAASLAVDTSGTLYVADQPRAGGSPPDGKIDEFVPGASTPSLSITRGVFKPSALAFDASRNLYVANVNANTVTVYAPGATSPLRTISSGVKRPSALAFDARGNLYVANHRANTVTVYAPGSGAPLRTISDGISGPTALLLANSLVP